MLPFSGVFLLHDRDFVHELSADAFLGEWNDVQVWMLGMHGWLVCLKKLKATESEPRGEGLIRNRQRKRESGPEIDEAKSFSLLRGDPLRASDLYWIAGW